MLVKLCISSIELKYYKFAEVYIKINDCFVTKNSREISSFTKFRLYRFFFLMVW